MIYNIVDYLSTIWKECAESVPMFAAWSDKKKNYNDTNDTFRSLFW